MKKVLIGVALVFFLLNLTGTAIAAGAEIWAKKCALCHGKDGKGTTPMCQKLKCRDLTNPKVQEAFTDDQAAKGINEGVKDSSGKIVMPPFKEKLTAEEVKEIVKFLRTLKGK
ncbi:MAG: cytochrome c [Thermodesulfobacteriota bacterium]|jgi:cytochrome c6|nr:MAG: cytochrome c [Thermodesulfobacteriota bacterium]